MNYKLIYMYLCKLELGFHHYSFRDWLSLDSKLQYEILLKRHKFSNQPNPIMDRSPNLSHCNMKEMWDSFTTKL